MVGWIQAAFLLVKGKREVAFDPPTPKRQCWDEACNREGYHLFILFIVHLSHWDSRQIT